MNFIRRCRVRPFSHLDRLLTSECCSPQEQEPFLKIAPTRGWAAFRLRQRDYSMPWATPRTAHLKIHLVALMLLCNRLIFFRAPQHPLVTFDYIRVDCICSEESLMPTWESANSNEAISTQAEICNFQRHPLWNTCHFKRSLSLQSRRKYFSINDV
jgi:hypothetical protein